MSISSTEKLRRKRINKIRFPKVCKEVSEVTGIDVERVEKVVSHFMVTFKFFVDSPFLLKIKVIGLGTFTPRREVVAKRYSKTFLDYITGKIDRQSFIDREVKYRNWLKKLDADERCSRENNPVYKNYWRKLYKNYIKTKRRNK